MHPRGTGFGVESRCGVGSRSGSSSNDDSVELRGAGGEVRPLHWDPAVVLLSKETTRRSEDEGDDALRRPCALPRVAVERLELLGHTNYRQFLFSPRRLTNCVLCKTYPRKTTTRTFRAS